MCYAATSAAGCSNPFKSGWALNLLKPVGDPVVGIAERERVVSFPLVRQGVVIFATLIPDPEPCKSGGKSWLMTIDALGGGEFGGAPFDTNGDGVVDSNDFVMINGVSRAASGADLEVGIHKTPAIVESTSSADFGKVSGSSGIGEMTFSRDRSGIRRSWRQLK